MRNIFKPKKIIPIITTAVAMLLLYFVVTNIKKTKQPKEVQTKVKTTTFATKKNQYPDTVSGKIITLKKLKKEYAFDYYLAFDEDVRKGLEFPEKVTYGYVESYVSEQAEKVIEGSMIAYCIWDNADNKMVGSLQIRDLNDYDPGQLGMWINKDYRGKGRIQEALYLISKAYFKAKPNEKSYNAHVRPWNMASQKSMEKFGFKKTGNYIEDGKITRYILELFRENLKNPIK